VTCDIDRQGTATGRTGIDRERRQRSRRRLTTTDFQTGNPSTEPIGTRQTRSCEAEWRVEVKLHFHGAASGRTDAVADDVEILKPAFHCDDRSGFFDAV
jgi:hypothetical protein